MGGDGGAGLVHLVVAVVDGINVVGGLVVDVAVPLVLGLEAVGGAEDVGKVRVHAASEALGGVDMGDNGITMNGVGDGADGDLAGAMEALHEHELTVAVANHPHRELAMPLAVINQSRPRARGSDSSRGSHGSQEYWIALFTLISNYLIIFYVYIYS